MFSSMFVDIFGLVVLDRRMQQPAVRRGVQICDDLLGREARQ